MKKIIRYIGSKEKLLDFLNEVIFQDKNNIKILDGFTGTTVVSKYIQDNSNNDLYLSDISNYSEVLASRLFISKCNKNIFEHIDKIVSISKELNPNFKGIFFNEFSINGSPKTISQSFFQEQEIKSRMFFTSDVGMKIDLMRNYISSIKSEINHFELNLLLMLVVSFADKNANTTSVYGAYLKRQNRETFPIKNDFIDILKKEYNQKLKSPIQYYKSDIITTLDLIPELDVIYLDPPYNTRKYESNYHILNYLCDLNFNKDMIKINSKTGLPNNSIKNMFGSKKDTRIIFENMIVKSINKSKEVYISYSTDGEMSFEEIKAICDKHNLTLYCFTKDYKKYKSNNKSKNNTIKEIIYRITK